MKKNTNPYFNDFISMVNLSCKAAQHLQSVFSNYQTENLAKQRTEMHEIEHEEDEIKHELMRRLVKEFVPPIDREDIILMASVLDDVTDKIDDILIRVYMYNIQSVRPEALEFVDIISRCCTGLQKAIIEFPNFRKSTTLMQDVISVNTLEEEGDAIYIKAVRKLYESEKDPIQVSAWSELFDRLEDCCDACEHVADVMETIVMKNS